MKEFISSRLGSVPAGRYYLYVAAWESNVVRPFDEGLYEFEITAADKEELGNITEEYASTKQATSRGFPIRITTVDDRDAINRLRADFRAAK